HREPFSAVEAVAGENEVALRLEIRRARALRRLHYHLDGDPRGPIFAAHAPPPSELLEARVHLRRAVALPGPVPGHRLKVDRADYRARPHGVVRHLPGEVEG